MPHFYHTNLAFIPPVLKKLYSLVIELFDLGETVRSLCQVFARSLPIKFARFLSKNFTLL